MDCFDLLCPMELMNNNENVRQRQLILNQIDVLLQEIPLLESTKKEGVNCLLPVDCEKDVFKVICPLLIELKGYLGDVEYDSYRFGHFITEKFESALELEIHFPDEILGKLLKVFYSILFEIEDLTYSLKKYIAELLIKLLKKSKEIDKDYFKADWRDVYGIVSNFYYPKSETCPGFHSYQTATCSVFLELAKHIRRFYSLEAVDEIIEEFEGDLIATFSKEALRAARFIALLLPFEGLKEEQIKRVFVILKENVGKFKRISSQFDVFIVYILKKITKYNSSVLKKFNWEPLSCFVFEQILPSSLKIPSPVKGARKISKLMTKSDVAFGEEFFETLGNGIPSRIAKWIVYTMQNDFYEQSIHCKLLFFLDSLRSLCHPSNYGPWSIQIEIFLGYFAGTLAKQTNKNEKWLLDAPKALIDEIVEKIWNLSELLVFARSGPALSGMCISSFTCINLSNVRPDFIIPKMMLSISSALESVSEPHRTTSAIGLLQVSMPNLLKSPVGIVSVLSLLPTVVFGIDSNDQLKSIRTLSLFLSFCEAARVEDISNSESFGSSGLLSDVWQQAKELTGQFSDVFLLFTENIISYLRTISQGTNTSNNNNNEHDDLSRMILAIANCVYSRISGKIVELCLEKWMQLLEEDLGKMVTEIVGEVVAKIAKNHFPSLANKLIPSLLTKISDQIERGDGQLGSKDQSNNSLNNNLIILAHLFENNSKEYFKDKSSIDDFVLKVLTMITNRKSFLAGSRLFHSIVMGLIHYEIKELNCVSCDHNKYNSYNHSDDHSDKYSGDHSDKYSGDHSDKYSGDNSDKYSGDNSDKYSGDNSSHSHSNPHSHSHGAFDKWARWVKAEDLIEGKDFEFRMPSESDALKALKLIKSVQNWIKNQLENVSFINVNLLSKSESEKLFCLLQVVDNVNIDLLSVYNSFSSYNYGINEEIATFSVSDECLSLLQDNLKILRTISPIVASSGNLELEIQLVEIIGSIINGYPVNPEKSREKLKAIKRLNINYDRFHTDKERPVSFWILKAEAQFKLRRDLRFDLGDEKFESVLMAEFDGFIEILFDYCFKPYHMLRISAQSNFRLFMHKYISKSRGFICKILEFIEKRENVSESEFKGICFMLRNRFTDVICEDFELVERFLIGLLKLGVMPVAEEINESFEILNGTLNVFSDAFVPDNRVNSGRVKKLVLELIKIADLRSEKWTNQYLAMLSAHPMIEMCQIPEIFGLLAKFSLSKVAVIRNVAQNCFKVAIFGYFKGQIGSEAYWKFRDLTAMKIVLSGERVIVPVTAVSTVDNVDFDFLNSYLQFLCLPVDSEEGENVQFEYMNFIYLSRWISLFSPEDVKQFLMLIEDLFKDESLDLGKQRALCEIICAVLCSTSQENIDDSIWKLLKKSWNSLAIENLELWTCAIDEPLLWNDRLLMEISAFFYSSINSGNETARIILSIKMITKIYSQGLTTWFDPWLLCEALLKLCSHEYTSIVMESSKLLSLIALNNLKESDQQILSKLFANEKNSRAILQFFACSSTIPNLTNFWKFFEQNLANLLKMLQSENVQMLTDAKKAILTLFLAKGAEIGDLRLITKITLEFAKKREIPVKISKFCIELVQLLVQNNFSLFHARDSVEDFFVKHVDSLIVSDQIHLREASHGLILSLYQIDPKKSAKDSDFVTKNLQKMKSGVKGDLGMRERHGMCLRASGIILSEPHVLNKSLPALLTALSYYISDRSPISPLVRLTFNEFRRTHQDTWMVDRQLFDEDQLDAIGELLIAPSYYA